MLTSPLTPPYAPASVAPLPHRDGLPHLEEHAWPSRSTRSSWADRSSLRAPTRPARRPRRLRRSHRRGGPRRRCCATWSAPQTEVVDLAGGLLVPGFQDAHVHPVMGGLATCCGATCTAPPRREECLATVGAYAAAHPDLEWIVGGGWSMAALPGGTPTPAGARRGRARPPGVPDQPRRARRLGQQPGARRWPGSTPRHRRPGGRPDRARRRRQPGGHPARGRDGAGRPAACREADRAGPARPGCSSRPGATCSRWGSPAGRTPSSARCSDCPTSCRPTCAPPRRADAQGARGRRAVVGPRPRRRADRRAGRAPGGRARRGALRGDQREDHAGRGGGELHRRDARALPGRLRLPDGQRRAQLRGPGRPARAT